MRGAVVGNRLWLELVPFCCLLGCATVPTNPDPHNAPVDPFVEALVREEALQKKPGTAILKPDLVFREIPIQTPVADARAVLERHGFNCWSGVADIKGTCLHCTFYRRKTPYLADRVVVKIFYENKRVINAEVVVDYDVRHDERGYWAGLFTPVPPVVANPSTASK